MRMMRNSRILLQLLFLFAFLVVAQAFLLAPQHHELSLTSRRSFAVASNNKWRRNLVSSSSRTTIDGTSCDVIDYRQRRTAVSGSYYSRRRGSPSSFLTSSTSLRATTGGINKPSAEQQHAPLVHSTKYFQIKTLLRITLPSIVTGIGAFFAFPYASLFLVDLMSSSPGNAVGALTVLSQDSSQFVQNFLNVASVLFSILVGQTYGFMYQQQESVYYALFNEVTEAKSLLEQVALVCQGRSMYKRCLECINLYVQNDLKKLKYDPAVLLSARPVDDPLESLMYMTSVGVPSTIYETVKSLRQARAGRLGALQRKLPLIHIVLLWILAIIELVSFPLLGAGTQTIGGYHLLTVEGCLFGVMTCGIVLTMRVVGELWRVTGGAYNVDSVLQVMVRGLEEELNARMSGSKVYASSATGPSAPRDPVELSSSSSSAKALSTAALPIQQQGPNIGIAATRIYNWIRHGWMLIFHQSSSSKPKQYRRK